MIDKKFNIKKRSGKSEAFSKIKFMNSLNLAGASTAQAKAIFSQLQPKFKKGLNTRKLHQLTRSLLKKKNRKLSLNYNLPRAIQALGPDGHTFEQFMAAVFRAKGWKVQTNKIKKGACVSHEIDFIAKKGKRCIYAECKFHSRPSTKNDIKTALYVYARSQDLMNNPQNDLTEFLLVSNTKFSKDAVTYANCVGLKLLGPEQPDKSELCNLVKETRTFPVTCLSSLKKIYVKDLLAEEIITVKQLYQNRNYLYNLILTDEEYEKVMNEVELALGK